MEDCKEVTPNEKAIVDITALASAPLLGSNIMDEEGAALKENSLVSVAAPTEAIIAEVFAANAPKEKPAAGADEASSFF